MLLPGWCLWLRWAEQRSSVRTGTPPGSWASGQLTPPPGPGNLWSWAEQLRRRRRHPASSREGVTILPRGALGGAGLVTMDLAGGGAGDDGGGLPVDHHSEAVVLADHGGGLACVGHPGLDRLAGDHDPAPGGDPPLHGDGPPPLPRGAPR